MAEHYLRKYVQILIEIFVTEKFNEGSLDEWGDEEDEYPYCNVSLLDIKKKVYIIENV